MKKVYIYSLAVLLLFGLSGFYVFKEFGKKKWKIVFDEEKIKFRKEFLSNQTKAKEGVPNIIIIMADDLGKHEISAYGGKNVQTKNIDRIAQNGVRFDEGYISSPICAPSRAGMMTGRYQQRFGFEINIHERYPKNRFEYWIAKQFVSKEPFVVNKQNPPVFPDFEDMHKQGIPPTEFLLPELLKKHGYRTAIFGKWHLGYNNSAIPLSRGFDYHYGFLEAFSLYAPVNDSNIVNFRHDDFTDKHIWNKGRKGNCAIQRNGNIIEEKAYLTDKIADESVKWLLENHQNGPFFMYLPFSAPHTPFQAKKEIYDLYAHVEDKNKRVYYAMIHSLDAAVGKLLDQLDELNLTGNTLIFFLSDNGGAIYTHAADNSPLKSGKFSNFEGGINVPFLMSWPKQIESGKVYKYPVSSLDIFATICKAGAVKLPSDRGYDGVNLIPFIHENSDMIPHPALFWRSMHHKAIRKDNWKLIWDDLGKGMALYNISTDKSEKVNLAKTNADIVSMLKSDFENWEKQLIQSNWPRVMDFKIEDGDAVYYFPL
jgi:arylsulfatase A-like enzyme